MVRSNRLRLVVSTRTSFTLPCFPNREMSHRAIELNFGIMCNCLAVLKPLVRLVFPMLIPTSRGSDRYPPGRSYPSRSLRHQNQPGSHQLESFDKNEGNGGGGGGPGRRFHHHSKKKSEDITGITVTSSYQVHTQSDNEGDTESTENIIESRGIVREYHRMV
jgi:hypothetical protein